MKGAIAFAVIAVVAGAVGVSNLAVTAIAIAKLVFFICLVVVPVVLTFALIFGRSPKPAGWTKRVKTSDGVKSESRA